MKEILVFTLSTYRKIVPAKENQASRVKKWVPGIMKYIPPGASFNNLLFWLAHYFRVFKNKNYCSYQLSKGNKIVSSIVCVPAMFVWPFMGKNDIQIKGIFTHPDFRGKGLAFYLLSKALSELKNEKTTFWYMTHSENFGSIALAKKTGFTLHGIYKKNKRKHFFFKTGTIIKTN